MAMSDLEIANRLETALGAIGAFFMGDSPVQQAAAEIARRLEDGGIDHAIAGAICLAAHGVTRATEDVDVLITREGLEQFKHAWLGRGYVNLRPGGKAVRDTLRITNPRPADGARRPSPVPAAPTAEFGLKDKPFIRPNKPADMVSALRHFAIGHWALASALKPPISDDTFL